MFDYIKKNLSITIGIILVFLIFSSITCISCDGKSEMIQERLVTGKINNITSVAVNNEDVNKSDEYINGDSKDNFNRSDSIDSQDIVTDKNIPEDNAGMENQEKEIIKEDVIEGQEQAGSEEKTEINDNTGQNDSLDIDFSNSDDFRIEVDLNSQKVLVYYKDNLIKEMICSGGTAEKPTLKGEFKTTQKGEWFFSDKYNMGAHYWIRFYHDYLFHSVPFNKNDQMIKEEYDKLGSPASHGCIRLEVKNAKWLYEMLPIGVKVLIY